MSRKGAIAAHKGEKVLIPINMRDGSVLAVGKGNPEQEDKNEFPDNKYGKDGTEYYQFEKRERIVCKGYSGSRRYLANE